MRVPSRLRSYRGADSGSSAPVVPVACKDRAALGGVRTETVQDRAAGGSCQNGTAVSTLYRNMETLLPDCRLFAWSNAEVEQRFALARVKR